MNTYYLDWAHKGTKKLAVYKNDEPLALELEWTDLVALLLKDDILYCETGCPKKELNNLLKLGVDIRLVDSKKLHDLKGDEYIKETDVIDANFLRTAVLNEEVDFIKFNALTLALLPLRILEKNYDILEKTSVRLQNNISALKREFPEEVFSKQTLVLENTLKTIDIEKERIGRLLDNYFCLYKKALAIKGIGYRLLSRILISAPPQLFSTHRKYLKYCGYLGKNGGDLDFKYNRQTKMLFHLCAEQMIKGSNEIYEPIYRKMREEFNTSDKFKVKHELYNEKRKKRGLKKPVSLIYYSNVCALNKISTLICKEVYANFKNFDITKCVENSVELSKVIDQKNGVESFF